MRLTNKLNNPPRPAEIKSRDESFSNFAADRAVYCVSVDTSRYTIP